MIASTCVDECKNTGTIYGMQQLEQVRFVLSKVGEEILKAQSDYMKEVGPQQGSAASYLHHECINRRGTLTAPIGPHGEIWYS